MIAFQHLRFLQIIETLKSAIFQPSCPASLFFARPEVVGCPGIQVFEWVFPTFVFLYVSLLAVAPSSQCLKITQNVSF